MQSGGDPIGTFGDVSVVARFGFHPSNRLGVWVKLPVNVAPLAFSASAGASVAVPIGANPSFDLSAAGSLSITGVPGLPGSPTLAGSVDYTGGSPSLSAQLLPCGPASGKTEQPAIELLP